MLNTHQSKRLELMISDGQGPVMISFYNGACAKGACGTQNKYLHRLATDLKGSFARFESVDLDISPELAQIYQITTLPSAILFVDGEIHTRLSGLIDPGTLACTILQHVESGTHWMAQTGNICPMPSNAHL